jgi:hypothetical protein
MPYVDLSALPATPTAFGRWQPLNAPLGVGAFGINAIECDPGESIDTTHDETDTGQHEAYIVVAGRAEFRIGLDIYDAVPGTVVAAIRPPPARSGRLSRARASSASVPSRPPTRRRSESGSGSSHP